MFKKVLNFIWIFVEVFVVAYVFFITSCILCRNEYGYTQFGKYTLVYIQEDATKYINNVKNGDLLVVREVENIRVGDVIYYYSVIDGKYVVNSGVVKQKDSEYILDNIDSVSYNKILGVYVGKYPFLGKIIEILESDFGFLLLVLLPMLIVFAYQVYEFVIVLKFERKKYDDKLHANTKENVKSLENIVINKTLETEKNMSDAKRIVENIIDVENLPISDDNIEIL